MKNDLPTEISVEAWEAKPKPLILDSDFYSTNGYLKHISLLLTHTALTLTFLVFVLSVTNTKGFIVCGAVRNLISGLIEHDIPVDAKFFIFFLNSYD